MPRNASGLYTRPPGTMAVAGALITDEIFNDSMDDIAQALTESATVGQLEGFSGRYTTTGTGAAYTLTVAGLPSDLSKMMALTFKAHTSNIVADVVLTGTLNPGSTVIPDASTIAGLSVGQAISTALAPFSFSGSVVQGQYTVTGVSSTAGLTVGMPISSATTGVQAGTTIAAISGTVVTLSSTWTGASAGGIVFSATPGIQPNTTIAAIGSTTNAAGVTTNTIVLSAPIVGQTVPGATITAASGTPRLTVNTAPARSLVAPDGSALRAGEIVGGQIYTTFYDAARLAYVLDSLPGRVRVAPTDAKAGYLADKMFDAYGAPAQTAVKDGQTVIILPTSGFAVGDFLTTGRAAPSGYLRRDGSIYLQSSYPTLFAAIGLRFQSFTYGGFGSQNARITGLANGAGVYVTVFDNGSITSGTGLSGQMSQLTGASPFRGVIFANALFVAVGDGGTIRTSPDGVTWTTRTAPSRDFRSVTFGNGLYVATTTTGFVATSPDGVMWTERAAFAANAATFANALFVAVGPSGTVATSPDGIAWTQRAGVDATTTWRGVTYANGTFVAVGGNTSGPGFGRVMTSPTGLVWTPQSPPNGAGLYALTFGFGLFFAIGGPETYSAGGTVLARQIISQDGVTWNALATPPSFNALSELKAILTTPTGFAFGVYNTGALISAPVPNANYLTQFAVPADDPNLGYIRAL